MNLQEQEERLVALLTAFHGGAGGGILMEELIAEGAQAVAEVLVCAIGFVSSYINNTAATQGRPASELISDLGLYVATEKWT